MTTAAILKGLGNVNIIGDETKITTAAYEVIQHYSSKKLARFLFSLPRADAMVNQGNNLMIIQEYLVDIYKGVENVLFEIYEDLRESEIFTDETVTRKLLSIVERTKNG